MKNKDYRKLLPPLIVIIIILVATILICPLVYPLTSPIKNRKELSKEAQTIKKLFFQSHLVPEVKTEDAWWLLENQKKKDELTISVAQELGVSSDTLKTHLGHTYVTHQCPVDFQASVEEDAELKKIKR